MRRIASGFALALALAHVARAGADKRAQAVQLADDSEKAYKAGHFEQAAALLSRAHDLYPEPILLYNLGRALEGMGDAKAAVAAYETYLHDAKQIDDRAAIERRIATLKAQIEREQQPEATPDGPATGAGQDHPAALPARDVPHPIDERDDDAVSRYLPWATIGVGGAALITGLGFGWRASVNHDDAVREPSQQRAVDLQRTATHDASIANVLFVVGGATAVGGAIWEYFTWQRGERASRSARVKLAPNGVAVQWAWR
jgi:tetratricopeptide (TPR) repeat protein